MLSCSNAAQLIIAMLDCRSVLDTKPARLLELRCSFTVCDQPPRVVAILCSHFDKVENGAPWT